jgi:hypothetical protein
MVHSDRPLLVPGVDIAGQLICRGAWPTGQGGESYALAVDAEQSESAVPLGEGQRILPDGRISYTK